MNNDDLYMQEALIEAKKAFADEEIPVGAVIVLNNEIISRGHNLKCSTGIVTNHAEIIAIQNANLKLNDWRLTNATMYVTLEPCPMCASAIQQSRIARVIYCVSSGSKSNISVIKEILNNPDNNHATEIIKNDKFEKQYKNIINAFFKKIR